ncbi:MAG TPA: hypothetical protein VIJ79_00925 [Acidobacteriaceae bacterium]
MPRFGFWMFCLLLAPPLCAQMQMPQFERISSDEAFDRALKNNVLTHKDSPFHAVLDIREKTGDPAYRGRVEIFWESEDKYRLVLDSRDFGQTLVVNGAPVMETDRGDFYPGWLRGFVTALMDPMPRMKDLRGQSGMVAVGPNMHSCVSRDDRPGGITNQLTWVQTCFTGEEPRLDFAMDFTYNMEFHDFAKFGKKQIARTYVTGEGDHARITGKLTTLEEWKPDEALLAVTRPTPPADRLITKFVSTATEESMLESAPKDVIWPPMREGKMDGYMIVHAITDRNGQVRETSKHNSDNPGLESFGREVALKYKFKPLIVNGVAQQMEMPLVLHFTSRLGNPITELDDAKTRKMISGCSLPHEIDDPASAGQQIVITFQVQDDGALMTLGSSDRKIAIPVLYEKFRGCHFSQYKEDGKPSAYHANLTVTAR